LDWWLLGLALVVLVLALLVLCLVPVRVAFSLQARGEPEGDYAVAGGGQVGPFATTFVLAHQTPLQVEVRLFGRRLLGPKREKRQPSRQPATRQLPAWVKRRLDPVELALFLGDERRRLALEWLTIDIDYSFRNVALTGQLLAALCALSALLPPSVQLRQHLSWDLAGRARLALDGRLRVWPGLFVIDSLRFLRQASMLPKSRVSETERRLEAHTESHTR